MLRERPWGIRIRGRGELRQQKCVLVSRENSCLHVLSRVPHAQDELAAIDFLRFGLVPMDVWKMLHCEREATLPPVQVSIHEVVADGPVSLPEGVVS